LPAKELGVDLEQVGYSVTPTGQFGGAILTVSRPQCLASLATVLRRLTERA
jgi:hypothetical protein